MKERVKKAKMTESPAKAVEAPAARPKKKMRRGRWNLVALGIGAVLVACVTTGVSLVIYHNSGDIYLDRSRPGYLPDEAEIEEESYDDNYDFEKSGKLDAGVIEEYLEELDIEAEAVDAYNKPFGAEALSNERLGIPTE